MTIFHRLILLAFLPVILLSACSAAPAQAPTALHATPWPTQGWQTSPPEQQGLDPYGLAKMQAAIEEQKIPLHSLLIIRHGYLVSESYYDRYTSGSLDEIYSVTKSFTATLVGIALDQRKLAGIDQKVADLLPGRSFANPDPSKQAMTLENLLTMTSGLDWKENDASFRALATSPDWVKMVMDLPMVAQPGQTFSYCSGCSHVISAIVKQQAGNELEFARKNLFDPLGITNYHWQQDPQGVLLGGWGLNLAPRDLAKLGYLYLNNGAWEGQPVVSAKWVQTATTQHFARPGDLGYGYQWWIYPRYNAFAALGRFGQMIFVSPSLDLVVVTTASTSDAQGHDPIFNLIDEYIVPAIKR